MKNIEILEKKIEILDKLLILALTLALFSITFAYSYKAGLVKHLEKQIEASELNPDSIK